MAAGSIIKNTALMAEKKKVSRIRLSEKYYGKKALLEEWEEFPGLDPDYLRDLRRRVRGHHNDLTYRGADDDDTEL
jgi:hypothetical protein